MKSSMHLLQLFLILSVGACQKTDSYSVKKGPYSAHKQVELAPTSTSEKSTSEKSEGEGQPSSSTGPEWVIVDQVSNVADAVRTESERATRDGKQLIVYVGAVWCKPCKEFQAASNQPGFGEELTRFRFMKFDWDLHQTPLIRADYGSQFLPLFVLPNSDGRGSKNRIFGARGKGREAIENLKKRLLTMVASGR